jgi:hypothetical protein
MSSSVELICVDPKRVLEVWPAVRHLITRAVLRTNLSHSSDIEYDTLHGDGLLWLAWDGRTVKAAATTVLTETDAGTVCILTACGGEDMAQWLPLLAKIEDYARAEGCGCVRIYGRKGWARVLPDYRVEHVILERSL